MNRNELINACNSILKTMATKYGFNYLVETEDRQKGIWGESFTEFLENTVGECTKGYLIFKDKDHMNKYDPYLEFRYRFSDPCISYNFYEEKDGIKVQCLASLEFHTDIYVPTGKFYEEDSASGIFKKGDPIKELRNIPAELSEVQLFHPEYSLKYFLEMKELWDKLNK